MADFRVIRPVLLAAGIFALAGCASMSASSRELDEKYFQAEAKNYQKYLHDGRVVYCTSESAVGTLVPGNQCIWESALRQKVQQARRDRNAVVNNAHLR
jgi:hypothetical protein